MGRSSVPELGIGEEFVSVSIYFVLTFVCMDRSPSGSPIETTMILLEVNAPDDGILEYIIIPFEISLGARGLNYGFAGLNSLDSTVILFGDEEQYQMVLHVAAINQLTVAIRQLRNVTSAEQARAMQCM